MDDWYSTEKKTPLRFRRKIDQLENFLKYLKAESFPGYSDSSPSATPADVIVITMAPKLYIVYGALFPCRRI